MAKTKHGILAKMLAAFAKDAEPEEVAEAVEVIDGIVSEDPEAEAPKATDNDVAGKLDTITDLLQNLPGKKAEEDEDETELPEEPAKDGEPDKLDTVIDLLKQLLAASGKDEEPEEVDPLKKLEDDLDELEEKQDEEATDEDEEEEEETFTPDEDPAEPESHFVDPDEINEQDEEEAPEEEEEVQTDKRACDAVRAAIKAVKPVIAKLPPSERRAAADAAAASIRKSYGLSAKANRNDYLAIRSRKVKKASDKAANYDSGKELGKRIMAARNANKKK